MVKMIAFKAYSEKSIILKHIYSTLNTDQSPHGREISYYQSTPATMFRALIIYKT